MTFDEAKNKQQSIENKVNAANDVVNSFPRMSDGRVTDTIRESKEYRDAAAAFDYAFSQLRQFNSWYVKQFKAEIRKERNEKNLQRQSNLHHV